MAKCAKDGVLVQQHLGDAGVHVVKRLRHSTNLGGAVGGHGQDALAKPHARSGLRQARQGHHQPAGEDQQRPKHQGVKHQGAKDHTAVERAFLCQRGHPTAQPIALRACAQGDKGFHWRHGPRRGGIRCVCGRLTRAQSCKAGSGLHVINKDAMVAQRRLGAIFQSRITP